MAINQQAITLEQFEAFINLSDNADKLFELIGGEIIEVPSNPYVSYIASKISGYIFVYLLTNNIGHLTGEAGGYQVAGEQYAPDVGFISYIKQKKLAKQGYNPNPPDLAVEVISSDSRIENQKITIKLSNYLSVGTVVWIVRPDTARVEVHHAGEKVQTYRHGDTLSGGDLLPDFELAIDDIFDDSNDE